MKKTSVLIVTTNKLRAQELSSLCGSIDYQSIQTYSKELANRIASDMKPNIAIIDVTLAKEYEGLEVAVSLQKVLSCPVILIALEGSPELIERCKKPYIFNLLINPKTDELLLALDSALYQFKKMKQLAQSIEKLQQELDVLKLQYYKSRIRSTALDDFADGYHYSDRDCATYYQGKKIPLTVKENMLVRLLASSAGLSVSLEEIEGYIWDDGEEVDEGSVRTLVWRLREALPTDIVKSVTGRGYRI